MPISHWVQQQYGLKWAPTFIIYFITSIIKIKPAEHCRSQKTDGGTHVTWRKKNTCPLQHRTDTQHQTEHIVGSQWGICHVIAAALVPQS